MKNWKDVLNRYVVKYIDIETVIVFIILLFILGAVCGGKQ